MLHCARLKYRQIKIVFNLLIPILRQIVVAATTKIRDKTRMEASNRVQEGQYVHYPSYFQLNGFAEPAVSPFTNQYLRY